VWASPTTRVEWTYLLHSCLVVFWLCFSLNDCCPCEPTSLKILPIVLAWRCPCTCLYYYIPAMSHPPRSPRCSTRTHFLSLTSCPCGFVFFYAYMWSRSLSFLSVLVCDLLPRRLFSWFVKGALHCHKSISVTILTSTAWRTLGLFGAFPTLVGHHWSLGATFLGSYGDWLRELVSPRMHGMPSHQHCVLFYPLVGDLLGSAIKQVMLRSSDPGQVLGS